MKAEKAIKEFAEKVAAKVTWAGAIGIDNNWLVEPLTALISEHYYPKEFVEWAIRLGQSEFDNTLYHYISVPTHMKEFKETKELIFKDMDEAFNYWKENER